MLPITQKVPMAANNSRSRIFPTRFTNLPSVSASRGAGLRARFMALLVAGRGTATIVSFGCSQQVPDTSAPGQEYGFHCSAAFRREVGTRRGPCSQSWQKFQCLDRWLGCRDQIPSHLLPRTSTFHLFSNITVCEPRADAMLPVALKPCAKTDRVKFCGTEFWPSESCTVTLMGKDPTAVAAGVPESTPPLVSGAIPGGNAPVSLQF